MGVAEMAIRGGVIALLLTGAVYDVRQRRIPNALTLGGALVGLLVNLVLNGRPGALASLEGWGLGVLLLLLPFVMRGIGGGDVKLLAAAGAWGGPTYVFTTALVAAFAGAVLAIGVLVANRRVEAAARPILFWIRAQLTLALALLTPRALALAPRDSGEAISSSLIPEPAKLSVPYGPALILGGLVALFLG